jgi:hypothetical protein
MAQSWLIVERLENWEVDAANNFSFFGLSNRYSRTVSAIAENDLVFCYVSGVGAFSDIRRIEENGLKALKNQSYSSAFPFSLSTKPVLIVSRSKWVPIKSVASELDLTRGKTDYRNLFQTSIRKLTEHDSSFLEEKLRSAANETAGGSGAKPINRGSTSRPTDRMEGGPKSRRE